MSVQNAKTIPKWAIGLHRVGLYFEGFVENAPVVLEDYYKDTITSFGVRDSSRNSHPTYNTRRRETLMKPNSNRAKRYVYTVFNCIHNAI